MNVKQGPEIVHSLYQHPLQLIHPCCALFLGWVKAILNLKALCVDRRLCPLPRRQALGRLRVTRVATPGLGSDALNRLIFDAFNGLRFWFVVLEHCLHRIWIVGLLDHQLAHVMLVLPCRFAFGDANQFQDESSEFEIVQVSV